MSKKLLSILLSILLAGSLLAAPIMAAADGTTIIGYVTITHSTNVNIRSGGSTAYPVVAIALPGTVYQCTGYADTGWYEILLPDNSCAYVSNKMASLTYHAAPIPMDSAVNVANVRAAVLVYYQTSAGEALHSEYVQCSYGANNIIANDTKVPAGYALTGPRIVTVNVDQNSVATPSSVIFTYSLTYAQTPATQPPLPQAPIQYASVPIYYKDLYGTLLHMAYVYLQPGSTLLSADDTLVPGYELVGAKDAVVSVSAQGVASPSSVTFLYTNAQAPIASPQEPAAPQAPMTTVTIPIYYMDVGGALLNTVSVLAGYGANTIYANDADVPAGYRLVSNRSVQVQVDQYGNATPSAVSFTYQPNITAVVPVNYQDENGRSLHSENLTLSLGSNTIAANDGRVPAGYTLTSPRTVAVTVAANGTASPASVTFTYKAPLPPVSVNIPVIYRNQDGAQLAQTTALVSSAAPNQVRADPSNAPANYVLTSPGTVTVTVTPSGVATPAQVVFVYQDPATIKEPQYLPDYVKTKLNQGSFEVYTGPGPNYYRVPKASAGGNSGTCRVYGTLGDWALIGYGLSNGKYRIGYVTKAAVPANVLSQVKEIIITREPRTTTGGVYFTDDPVIGGDRETNRLAYYGKAGVQVNVLAWLRDPDSFWAYVEIENFKDGKPAWAFVARRKL